MFINYIKIAWRNITKRKFYSLLNIIGLSTGIVFTFLIGAYVFRELNVNKQLRNAKHQYFLKSEWKNPNLGNDLTTIGPIARRLKEDYPNLVNNYYRWDGITSIITKDDKHFREKIQIGDSTIFSMFGFGLLQGNEKTALNQPYSVVLTKEMALKYFGKTDIVGSTIGIQSFNNTSHDFVITGVLSPVSENSVVNLNEDNNNGFFIPTSSISYFPRADFESWFNLTLPSYVELKDGVTAKDLEQPIKKLIAESPAPQFAKNDLTVKAVPLTDYYLDKSNGLVKKMLYSVSFVGLFILLMAIANFVNIFISNSSARIKEIGIRKVMGGMKRQIIVQFLTESVILVLIATLIALALYPLLQPVFEMMVGKSIPELSNFPVYFIAIIVALIFVIGFAAGIYPAFVLSSLKSVDAIKGKLKDIKEKLWLRKSLAGFQFAIALLVMICALVVSKQINYFFSNDLGYNKSYVVASQVPRNWSPQGVRNIETIRDEFKRMPEVSDASLSYEIPNGNNGGQPSLYKSGTDSTSAIAMQSMVTDGNYLQTFQIPLTAGATFNESANVDSSDVLLNEAAAKSLGWNNSSQAIGQKLRIPGSPLECSVIGVTKDFHFSSMQQEIQPAVFFNLRLMNSYRFISFRIRPGNVATNIAAIEKKWSSLLPGSSFEYQFMDDVLKKVYQSELQIQKTAYTATVLSIIIVLLGVLGLVSLSVQKRMKEISVRKVLGASGSSITVLFMKEFVPVIVIAGLIAFPLAWIIMQEWLKAYAYRITLSFEPFLYSLAGLAAITVALIVLQTLKAVVANPVKSLRAE